MGSMQPLPSGNVFMGWGFLPSMTEHLRDGTIIFHASFSNIKGSYRAFKSPWKGVPNNPPDLWIYSRNNTTALYMSWNGATEVAPWKLHVSASKTGPFELAAVAGKQGFETMHSLDSYHTWAYVEAVSSDDAVLGTSRVMAAFVPPPAITALCDGFGCPNAPLGNDGGGHHGQSSSVPHGRKGQVLTDASNDADADLALGTCSWSFGILGSFLHLAVLAAAMAAVIYAVVALPSFRRQRRSISLLISHRSGPSVRS
jgi:hypothetical protein